MLLFFQIIYDIYASFEKDRLVENITWYHPITDKQLLVLYSKTCPFLELVSWPQVPEMDQVSLSYAHHLSPLVTPSRLAQGSCSGSREKRIGTGKQRAWVW